MKEKEVKRVLLGRQPMYLLMSRDYCLSSIASFFPLGVKELLKKFGDVFPKDPPSWVNSFKRDRAPNLSHSRSFLTK